MSCKLFTIYFLSAFALPNGQSKISLVVSMGKLLFNLFLMATHQSFFGYRHYRGREGLRRSDIIFFSSSCTLSFTSTTSISLFMNNFPDISVQVRRQPVPVKQPYNSLQPNGPKFFLEHLVPYSSPGFQIGACQQSEFEIAVFGLCEHLRSAKLVPLWLSLFLSSLV